MRTWLFHPLIFYPLAVLLAALAIAISVQPQAWPRPAAAVAGQRTGAALVLQNGAFNSPEANPAEQYVTVERDFMGEAQSLRIAVLANQPAPGPNDTGVRILLTPEAAAQIAGQPVTVDVAYNPLPVNPVSSLAVSLQGGGPAQWVTRPTPAQHGVLRFNLPAQAGANAIGLRPVSSGSDQAYGIEVTRIVVTPHPGGASAN